MHSTPARVLAVLALVLGAGAAWFGLKHPGDEAAAAPAAGPALALAAAWAAPLAAAGQPEATRAQQAVRRDGPLLSIDAQGLRLDELAGAVAAASGVAVRVEAGADDRVSVHVPAMAVDQAVLELARQLQRAHALIWRDQPRALRELVLQAGAADRQAPQRAAEMVPPRSAWGADARQEILPFTPPPGGVEPTVHDNLLAACRQQGCDSS